MTEPARNHEPLRAFFAIPLSEELRTRYSLFLEEARIAHSELRWTRPENAHLTLRFLGDSTSAQRREVTVHLATTAEAMAPFEIELGDPECFGSARVPRTLFFSIARGLEPLHMLADAAEDGARLAGFSPERKPWRGHLTVARNPRRRVVNGWRESLLASGLPGLCWRVEDLKLYASRLRRLGPEYTLLTSIKLGTGRVL